MPATYVHKCDRCRAKAVETQYSMSLVGAEDKLPQEVRQEISCSPETCRHSFFRKKNTTQQELEKFVEEHEGYLWPRVPQVPQLAGASGGTFKTEKELVADKKKLRQRRSRLHFKNDVIPTLSPRDQQRFTRKWAHLKGDHEKIKT